MPPSLPPYLTSGASSRAHHALLVTLNQAKSAHEEDELINREVRRCKEVLGVKGQSTSKITETLIILLHCWTISYRVLDDAGEWALIPALQLAEGGRNLRERRIGYLYLAERLPAGHELNLMLINTIRKDLSSSIPQEVLLALHTIIKMPSHDLSPAVTPLLTSKALLRHSSSAIRQRTLQALSALYLAPDDLTRTVGPKSFPLSVPKLTKLLGQETSTSVAAVLLRLIRQIVEKRAHRLDGGEERGYLIEQVIAQSKRLEVGGQLVLDVSKTCGILLADSENRLAGEVVVEWIQSRLKAIQHKDRWDGALLLESCQLLSSLPTLLHVLNPLTNTLIDHIALLLTPKFSSSSTASSLPAANDHILALKCLAFLPRSSWDGALGDNEMRTIMEGLNSPDPSIRAATLRILNRISPQLLDAALHNHLESLHDLTNLALPLGVPSDIGQERKLRLGREETGLRALEVVDVRAELRERSGRGAADGGREYCSGLLEILHAIRAQVKQGDVWEEGLRRVLETLRKATADFRAGCVSALFSDHGSGSPTLAALQATVSAEYAEVLELGAKRIIEVLLKQLKAQNNASVQELILVASVGLISAASREDRHEALNALRTAAKEVQSEGRYLQSRASQILDILTDDLLDQIYQVSKSRTLPDILQAIVSVHQTHLRRKQSTPPHSSAPSMSTSIRSPSGPNGLKYDAYEPPRVHNQSLPPSARASSRSPSVKSPTSKRWNGLGRGVSAGEYALMDAGYGSRNDVEDADEVRHNLMGLSLDGRSPRREPLDPFSTDDVPTPRMK